MQEYLIITLLILNLIGVIYLVTRDLLKRKMEKQPNLQQENQLQFSLEMSELKRMMTHNQKLFENEFKRLRDLQQAVLPSKDEDQVNKGQNLFLYDRYKEIFELYGQGLTEEEIAKKLEKGCGEVSFILQLASKKRS